MSRVVVIGGGISGLAAAHRLARDGVGVTVVESTAVVGGKLRVSDVAGIPVDEGAETFLRRAPEAVELITELGQADEIASPAVSGASVWARGRLRPLPARTLLGVPSDPRSLVGVLSAAEVLRLRADRLLPGQPPVDDVAVGAWVGRRMGRAVVDRLVDPLLGGVYAGRADALSLAATLPQLPRDERSALAAARRALGPPPPPDADPPPVFGTLTDGLGALPQLLAAAIVRLGGAVLLGRTVRSLRRDAAGWHVVHGPTTDERFLMADAVVLAVPAAPASRLLADVAPQGSAELAAIESASVAIVTTAWRSDDVPDVVGTGYLVPAQRDRPVKAVTFSSAKWAHLHRPKLAVVRCSIGRYGEVSDLQRDDDDLVKMASHELTSYAGFRGAPVESRVTRWGGGLPQYAVGHRERVERIRRAVAAQPGLGICGAGYDGVGIPACIRTGRLAAEHVMASLTSREER